MWMSKYDMLKRVISMPDDVMYNMLSSWDEDRSELVRRIVFETNFIVERLDNQGLESK